jgi:hypothetical protein
VSETNPHNPRKYDLSELIMQQKLTPFDVSLSEEQENKLQMITEHRDRLKTPDANNENSSTVYLTSTLESGGFEQLEVIEVEVEGIKGHQARWSAPEKVRKTFNLAVGETDSNGDDLLENGEKIDKKWLKPQIFEKILSSDAPRAVKSRAHEISRDHARSRVDIILDSEIKKLKKDKQLTHEQSAIVSDKITKVSKSAGRLAMFRRKK